MTSEQLNRMLSEVKDVASRAERAKLCRSLLASSVDYIYEQAGEPMPKKATLLELLDSPTVTGFVNDADTVQALHYVRILGMNAEHGRNVRKKESSLSLANMSYFVGLVEAKEQGTEASYQKPPYMSEAETRKLYIDLYLQEAGWDVLDANHVAQPGKACVEIEVPGMPNTQGVGYCGGGTTLYSDVVYLKKQPYLRKADAIRSTFMVTAWKKSTVTNLCSITLTGTVQRSLMGFTRIATSWRSIRWRSWN